jgi:putative ABC transport system ATP-binding protein
MRHSAWLRKMTAILELKHATKVYDQGSVKVIAVNGVSLTLESSQVALIMGPSGSGKTTLLSMMGCILRPTSGEVLVDGEIVSRLKEGQLPNLRKSHFGFVFQSFNLFSSLTAAENVEVALRLRHWNRQLLKTEAQRLLAEVGLESRSRFYPKDLSGGEKQRVAFARALAGNPRIILADEPTANLDSTTGREVLALLKTAAERDGKAVCVVSHDPKAETVAHKVLVLEDGKVKS